MNGEEYIEAEEPNSVPVSKKKVEKKIEKENVRKMDSAAVTLSALDRLRIWRRKIDHKEVANVGDFNFTAARKIYFCYTTKFGWMTTWSKRFRCWNRQNRADNYEWSRTRPSKRDFREVMGTLRR